MIVVAMRRLSHGEGLPVPDYQSCGAAGMDLYAAVDSETPYFLAPGHWEALPTGLALELPMGYEAQIRPRSGLALHHGVSILNAPGTIDSDYRGEIRVLLINHGAHPFEITRGMRIAQMVIAPVLRVSLNLQICLTDTLRGEDGFGSTGFFEDAADRKISPPFVTPSLS